MLVQFDGSACCTAVWMLVALLNPCFKAYWPPARRACCNWICCCAILPSSTTAITAGTSTKATNGNSSADMPPRSRSTLLQACNTLRTMQTRHIIESLQEPQLVRLRYARALARATAGIKQGRAVPGNGDRFTDQLGT